MRIRKAMVLAAGEGTRLRPLTETRAKPVIPVLNRPLIGHTLRLLARCGVEQVAVNLHHLAEQVREVIGDGSGYGVSVVFSCEEKLLGTAGAVAKMASLFDEDFYVIYGDNFLNVDLPALARLQAEKGGEGVIGLFRATDPAACGIVERDRDGRVTRFCEKPAPGETTSDAANAGVYVLSPAMLDRIPAGEYADFGRDIFPAALAGGASIYAGYVDGYLEDTGTIERYRGVCFDILDGCVGDNADVPIRGRTYVAEDAQTAGADIGPYTALATGVKVREGAFLSRSLLWERCAVGAGAMIKDSILAEECMIGDGVRVRGSVLGAGTQVGNDARLDQCALPAGSRVEPGAVVCGVGEEKQQ
jgi:NDP-sugar pyrophosphorylase family protein